MALFLITPDATAVMYSCTIECSIEEASRRADVVADSVVVDVDDDGVGRPPDRCDVEQPPDHAEAIRSAPPMPLARSSSRRVQVGAASSNARSRSQPPGGNCAGSTKPSRPSKPRGIVSWAPLPSMVPKATACCAMLGKGAQD